jgi:hypothetical protein
MPFLDVSDIVVDPDFADLMTVTRRGESVSAATGRSETNLQVFDDVIGTVTMQDPADLLRREDSDSAPRLIFIATTFRMIPVSKGFKPDVITWPQVGQPGSTRYTVLKCYPYPRYGAGIYEVVAESMNATDEAL